MLFTFGQWQIDVDVGRTSAFYRHANKMTDCCACYDCCNYEQATELFPNEVQEFFANLGVDLKKTAEVWETDTNDGGKTVNYSGFYHLCGTVLSGESCWVSVYKNKKAETFHLDEDGLYQIAEGFSVGFHDNCSLMEEKFPSPAIQMEIAFRCPWVLETPYPEPETLEKEHGLRFLAAVRKLLGK